jgi:hypothetical protein
MAILAILLVCRYARKKVLAETCTTGESRDSVKYYMRCKHQSCPARKTVRVFVPEFDFVVQMVHDHCHDVGTDPPKQSAGQAVLNRRPHEAKVADPLYHAQRQGSYHAAKENAGISDCNSLSASIQANLMLQALSAQLTAGHQNSMRPCQSAVAPNDTQTELILNLLAV